MPPFLTSYTSNKEKNVSSGFQILGWISWRVGASRLYVCCLLFHNLIMGPFHICYHLMVGGVSKCLNVLAYPTRGLISLCHYRESLHRLPPPQALEAQEQEKERLRLPQQNPSPVPSSQRSGSPRSDHTSTPEPQNSPSPAASTPDLTTNTSSSTHPSLAPDLDQDQEPDTPSVNGEVESENTPPNGEAEQVTPSTGLCNKSQI